MLRPSSKDNLQNNSPQESDKSHLTNSKGLGWNLSGDAPHNQRYLLVGWGVTRGQGGGRGGTPKHRRPRVMGLSDTNQAHYALSYGGAQVSVLGTVATSESLSRA